jgi:hypothetical protein
MVKRFLLKFNKKDIFYIYIYSLQLYIKFNIKVPFNRVRGILKLSKHKLTRIRIFFQIAFKYGIIVYKCKFMYLLKTKF